MKTPHTVLLRKYLEVEGDGTNIIAFKEAGDELVGFVVRGEKYSWYEAFLRPIGFLYRHYLELELKYWIRKLNEEPSKQVKRLLTKHDLRNLWLALKPMIKPFCKSKEDKKILNFVEKVILTFNKYDPTGQEFRYTRTIQDTGTLRDIPQRINIKAFKCLIAKVSDFFEGLSGVVEV
jgi:hypothetical protein